MSQVTGTSDSKPGVVGESNTGVGVSGQCIGRRQAASPVYLQTTVY
jgi:hypothetical protein